MNKPQVDVVELGVVPVKMSPADAPMPAAAPTPAMQQVLDVLASFKAPPIEKSSPANAREAPTPKDAVMGVMAMKGEPPAVEMVGRVTHQVIPGPGGDLLTRVYTPKGKWAVPGDRVLSRRRLGDRQPRRLRRVATRARQCRGSGGGIGRVPPGAGAQVPRRRTTTPSRPTSGC